MRNAIYNVPAEYMIEAPMQHQSSEVSRNLGTGERSRLEFAKARQYVLQAIDATAILFQREPNLPMPFDKPEEITTPMNPLQTRWSWIVNGKGFRAEALISLSPLQQEHNYRVAVGSHIQLIDAQGNPEGKEWKKVYMAVEREFPKLGTSKEETVIMELASQIKEGLIKPVDKDYEGAFIDLADAPIIARSLRNQAISS